MNDIILQMHTAISEEISELSRDIDVRYDGNSYFIFEGMYVIIEAEVYTRYDTFNFGEINFSNQAFFDPSTTKEALSEISQREADCSSFNM